jgi:hypothetical protein
LEEPFFLSFLQINLEMPGEDAYVRFKEKGIVVSRHIVNLQLSAGQFNPATVGIIGIANRFLARPKAGYLPQIGFRNISIRRCMECLANLFQVARLKKGLDVYPGFSQVSACSVINKGKALARRKPK